MTTNETKKTTIPGSAQNNQNTGKTPEKGTNKTIIAFGIFMIALALVLAPILIITGNKKKAENERVAALKQQTAQFDATVISIEP